jgi:hypothetical protein
MWGLWALETKFNFDDGGKFWELQYFTNWGIWMTTALFTVLVIAHIKNSDSTPSNSTWVMWKWCTALHQMTWVWNGIITVFFWSVLFPFDDGIYSSKLHHWATFMDHICPFTFITVDWALASMRYEKTTILINLGVACVYGLVNILFTKITGNAVYPPVLTWDSLLSWVIGFALIPLFALAFYLQYWATNWKISKMAPKENLRNSLI